jgi:hypothetical protein
MQLSSPSMHRVHILWKRHNSHHIFFIFEVDCFFQKTFYHFFRTCFAFPLQFWPLALGHYTFRQRLLNEARKHAGVRVLLVNEAFTSKTCGNCGWIHKTLAGNKDFRCRECNTRMDRDFNGARNVLLRFLGEVYTKKAQAETGLSPCTSRGSMPVTDWQNM